MENTENFENTSFENIKFVNPALNSKTGGLSYSAGVAAVFVVSILSYILMTVMASLGVDQDEPRLLYISFLVSPVALAATCAFMLKRYRIAFKEVAPLKCHPRYYALSLILMFGTLFALSWINVVVVEFFKLFGYEENATLAQLEQFIMSMDGFEFVLVIIIVAVIPAVLEELMFRGLILRTIEPSVGSVRAILLSGFLFSLFHGSPEQTVYQFIMGCLFAFIAVRSRSLVPSTVAHFLNNAIVLALTYFGLSDTDGNLNVPTAANIALTVVAVMCLIGGIVWLVLDKTELEKFKKGSIKQLFIYASFGIAVMALTWILSLVGI